MLITALDNSTGTLGLRTPARVPDSFLAPGPSAQNTGRGPRGQIRGRHTPSGTLRLRNRAGCLIRTAITSHDHPSQDALRAPRSPQEHQDALTGPPEPPDPSKRSQRLLEAPRRHHSQQALRPTRSSTKSAFLNLPFGATARLVRDSSISKGLRPS